MPQAALEQDHSSDGPLASMTFHMVTPSSYYVCAAPLRHAETLASVTRSCQMHDNGLYMSDDCVQISRAIHTAKWRVRITRLSSVRRRTSEGDRARPPSRLLSPRPSPRCRGPVSLRSRLLRLPERLRFARRRSGEREVCWRRDRSLLELSLLSLLLLLLLLLLELLSLLLLREALRKCHSNDWAACWREEAQCHSAASACGELHPPHQDA